MGQADYKFRYAFTVTGNEVKVTREGKPVDVTFSITDKDGKDSAKPITSVSAINRTPAR